MAIYTFSTKDKAKPEDKEDIDAIKLYCERKGLNFSSLVIKLLREWKKENVND